MQVLRKDVRDSRFASHLTHFVQRMGCIERREFRDQPLAKCRLEKVLHHDMPKWISPLELIGNFARPRDQARGESMQHNFKITDTFPGNLT